MFQQRYIIPSNLQYSWPFEDSKSVVVPTVSSVMSGSICVQRSYRYSVQIKLLSGHIYGIGIQIEAKYNIWLHLDYTSLCMARPFSFALK